MKILIVYALGVECGVINLPGHDILLCETGVGKVSAALKTYSSLLQFEPEMVLSIGSAGAIHHPIGSIVVCSKYVDRDLEKITELGVPCFLDFQDELAAFNVSEPYHGCISSGDTFQTTVKQGGIKADVFDMEAYGSAQICKERGLPLLAIKYVTDVIGQNSISHWEENVKHAKKGLQDFLETLNLSKKSE